MRDIMIKDYLKIMKDLGIFKISEIIGCLLLSLQTKRRNFSHSLIDNKSRRKILQRKQSYL